MLTSDAEQIVRRSFSSVVYFMAELGLRFETPLFLAVNSRFLLLLNELSTIIIIRFL